MNPDSTNAADLMHKRQGREVCMEPCLSSSFVLLLPAILQREDPNKQTQLHLYM